MKYTPISDEQREYVLNHINDRPRVKVARDAGISVTKVYDIVRSCGGNLDYSRSRRNPEWERIIREHYPSMAGHEIERKFGITLNRANKIAKQLGIEHNDETKARIKAEERNRLMAAKKTLDYKAIVQKRRTRRHIDEMRVWEGRKPLYHYKLKTMPRKSYAAKWHLANRYGYFEIEDEPYMLGYDDETQRRITPNLVCKSFDEDYYSRRYGLQFVAV